MTDPKPDVCRVMAEQIWEHITIWADEEQYKEETSALIAEAIRNHTIVPEMVELFKTQTTFMANLVYAIINHNLQESVPAIKTLLEANKGLGAKCMSISAKAQGKK